MATLIPSSTLSTLQRMSEDTMPDNVTVETYATTQDEGGGFARGVVSTVETKGRASRFGQISQHILKLAIPLEVEVPEHSVIVLDSPRLGESGRFVPELASPGSYSVHREMLLRPEQTP